MRLIDADRLLTDRMKSKYYHLPNGDIAIPLIDIEHAPTIEERKTGRWIKVNGKTAINCSACYHCSWSLSFEDTVKRFKFCPNCGAKMEEGDRT